MSVWACSGPGGMQTMAAADRYAELSALWVFGLLVPAVCLLVHSGHPRLALVQLLLLVFHPTWTISAYGGDCGRLKVAVSTTFIVMAAIGLLSSIPVAICWRKPWRS